MKKYIIQLSFIFWIATISNVVAQTNFPPKPQPIRFVNDFANFLTKEEVQRLETKLQSYDEEITTQLVVVTIETLEGLSVEEYANTLARN